MATQSFANRRVLLDHHIRLVEAGDWLWFQGQHRVVDTVSKIKANGEKIISFKDGLHVNVMTPHYDDCWIPEILRAMVKFRTAGVPQTTGGRR